MEPRRKLTRPPRRRPQSWAEAEKQILERLITTRAQIRCRCGRQATDLHLLPSFEPAMQIQPACGRHDPAGYWIAIDDLVGDWSDWRDHLRNKLEGEQAWRQLLNWLWLVTG